MLTILDAIKLLAWHKVSHLVKITQFSKVHLCNAHEIRHSSNHSASTPYHWWVYLRHTNDGRLAVNQWISLSQKRIWPRYDLDLSLTTDPENLFSNSHSHHE